MKVAFLGLGNMGHNMAHNLLKAGHELVVWNRTSGKAIELKNAGAREANTPAEASQTAEVVFTMLADDPAVEAVVLGTQGLINGLQKGAIHVSCSTISVALSRQMAEAHQQREQHYVSAPVFGRPEAAAAAKLFMVAAGDKQVLDRCHPLFSAIGQHTFIMGSDPEMANVVKLSGNFLIASVIESLGEALALVSKYGIDPKVYLDMLTSTLFSAPVYKTYGGLIVDRKFEPAGFKLTLGLKDIRLALAAGEGANVPLPVASLIRDHFLAGAANGMADKDWSALALVAAQNAGLK